jgi:hypothetical protein
VSKLKVLIDDLIAWHQEVVPVRRQRDPQYTNTIRLLRMVANQRPTPTAPPDWFAEEAEWNAAVEAHMKRLLD